MSHTSPSTLGCETEDPGVHKGGTSSNPRTLLKTAASFGGKGEGVCQSDKVFQVAVPLLLKNSRYCRVAGFLFLGELWPALVGKFHSTYLDALVLGQPREL